MQKRSPAKRALIAEDDPTLCALLASLVGELGFDVTLVFDGAAAQRIVFAKPPDLLIVDIFLKGGSGLGVLSATSAARKPMKRVVLSNYATPDMRRKCRELGADRVFDKSNEIDALIQYCSRLASGDSGYSALGALT